ncbi:MAG TPA: hypothetical protein VLA74_01150 [Nitrososphaeraceae archaeon]|nr:hypothetical protein [Nitrososphaeraceae archaeon]
MIKKVPVCSKCGSGNLEKIVWTKMVSKFKWSEEHQSWNWNPLSKKIYIPTTKKARHWCNNCNYYQRVKWLTRKE